MNNIQHIDKKQIVVVSLDESRYSLYLSVVERVVRAVEITPLPKAPEFVLGVINVHGQIIPVVDIRKRLNLPQHNVTVDDQFILAHTSKRLIVLVVDSVIGIYELAEQEFVTTEQFLPGAEYIHGVAKFEGNLVLIYDLNQFLSLDNEQKLEVALVENKMKTAHKSHWKRENTV